jgi:hypothetical protein
MASMFGWILELKRLMGRTDVASGFCMEGLGTVIGQENVTGS